MTVATEAIAFLDLTALHKPLRHQLDRLWAETLDTSSFIGGDAVSDFEAQWAQYCGVEHAIGVANGTDAIELTLAALAIGPGDEVLVPANTFVATAEAVVTVGATPVFADVDPQTLLITADLIEAAITPRTRAVLVVHLYGQVPDMEAIARVCERHEVLLLEDSAQAHGALAADGRKAGGLGRAGTFSFYPGKNLGALGDGGAVTTNDAELAASIRILANHGRGDHLLHVVSGRNSRLDNLQARCLSIKLAHLDTWNRRRREVHARYRQHLVGTPVQQLTQVTGTQSVHHLEVIRVANRDAVRSYLDERGIGTGIHYARPCHQHPAFERFAPKHPLPVSEFAAISQLSLPMHPMMSDGQVDSVAAQVLRAVEECDANAAP